MYNNRTIANKPIIANATREVFTNEFNFIHYENTAIANKTQRTTVENLKKKFITMQSSA